MVNWLLLLDGMADGLLPWTDLPLLIRTKPMMFMGGA
jgi:hypothetical protein